MEINLMIKMTVVFVFSAGLYLISSRKNFRFIRLRSLKKKFSTDSVKSELKNLKIFKNLQRERTDKEIYEAISFLRNLTAVGLGKVMSTDTILEELMEMQSSMRTVYGRMLGMLRINRAEEAEELLFLHVGSEISRDFGRLLFRWDEINPSELTETLISHQRTLKEIRNTHQKKKDEVLSDIIYFPVVLNVIVILINFIYVGYFMEQQNIFQTMF